MDLRILNTCNNDCLYCLEKSLRKKNKFIKKELIFSLIEKNIVSNLYFYGGNPLLHPDLLEILNFSKTKGIKNIGLLSNSYNLNEIFLNKLLKYGLTNFGLYFNSFDSKKHNLVNGGGISYKKFLANLEILSNSDLYLKIIIHINNLNIKNIYKDLFILNKFYGIKSFDFVNYFPFDNSYKNREKLEYLPKDFREEIKDLFGIIKKLDLQVNFFKFNKDFFGDYKKYYSYDNGILSQIGEEDKNRLIGKNKPFCYIEERCDYCFLKDYCKL